MRQEGALEHLFQSAYLVISIKKPTKNQKITNPIHPPFFFNSFFLLPLSVVLYTIYLIVYVYENGR